MDSKLYEYAVSKLGEPEPHNVTHHIQRQKGARKRSGQNIQQGAIRTADWKCGCSYANEGFGNIYMQWCPSDKQYEKGDS